ncbi:PAS domain-containing protein [Parvularcula sp. ZS-1/3]|uniref:histidine kinase n=2 Tax=Parvularcula mediterranea TaxID=2732508 RepID=A0A7Y3RIM7_9PROT|nr:PAS domain-containing protein [Parvularcula mediterranea]
MALSQDYLEEEFAKLLSQPGALPFLDKAAFDGLWFMDLEKPGREWVSPGFWRALGYAQVPADQRPQDWRSLILEADREMVFENMRRHCENAGHAFDQIIRFKGAQNNTVTVRARGMAIREGGKPVRMLGAHTIVHDTRAHELDRQLSELIELSGDAVFAWSLKRGIRRWNRGAVSLFGVSSQTAAGADPNKLTSARYPNGWDEVAEALDAGEQWSGEVERRRADGSTIHTSARLSPIQISSDDVLILEINRDITAEHKANERLRLLNRELNHRVKNLFAIVQGLVSVSGRGESDPAVVTDKIQARIAALAAAHMISIEEEDIRAVSFRQVMEAVLAPYEQRKDQLTLRGLEAKLPRRAVTPVGMIFHELATNAVKYGAWSEPDGHLSVSWMAGDLGQGTNDINIVWTERFTRSGDAAPSAPPGLGLPLIQQSARQLDGELTRTWSAQGMETVLTFSLDEKVGGTRTRSASLGKGLKPAGNRPSDLN